MNKGNKPKHTAIPPKTEANADGKNNTMANVPVACFGQDNEEKLQYLEGLVSKQLDLYDWCEAKVSTLATIDAILVGAATVFFDKVKLQSAVPSIWIHLGNAGMVICLLFPLFLSLALSIWHIRPKMSSGKANANRPNHRSSNGIRQFKNKEEYGAYLTTLTYKDLCEDLSNQIFGMNHNIWENRNLIDKAVKLDLIGLSSFLIIVLYFTVLT